MIHRQLQAVLHDTLREAAARKLLWGVSLAGALSSLLLVWHLQTITRTGPHTALAALAQTNPNLYQPHVLVPQALAASAHLALWLQLAWQITLLGGFLAPLLQPAANLHLLTTPLPKPVFLLGRYLGCLALVTVGALTTLLPVWLYAAAKFHYWHTPYLLTLPAALLSAAATLALLLLLQTATNSPALTMVALTALSLIAAAAQTPGRLRQMTGSPALETAFTALSNLLPRHHEIGAWITQTILSPTPASPGPLFTMALSLILTLALAAALQSRREA